MGAKYFLIFVIRKAADAQDDVINAYNLIKSLTEAINFLFSRKNVIPG